MSTPNRDALHMHLRDLGVSTSVHTSRRPITTCTLHTAAAAVCERAWKEILTLPMYLGLTDGDIARMVDGVRSFAPAAVTR